MVAPLSSTRINELHVSDRYVNQKEKSLLVWLSEMEGDQSIFLKSSVIFSGIFIPFKLPELKDIAIQTKVEVDKGD